MEIRRWDTPFISPRAKLLLYITVKMETKGTRATKAIRGKMGLPALTEELLISV